MKQAKKVIIAKETKEGVTSKVFENAENCAKFLKTTKDNVYQAIRQEYKVKGGYFVDFQNESEP